MKHLGTQIEPVRAVETCFLGTHKMDVTRVADKLFSLMITATSVRAASRLRERRSACVSLCQTTIAWYNLVGL